MRGTKVGTHLWCISLSLHFRKSSVGTVHVSSWVPSLPPAAGPGSEEVSIGKGWVKDSLGTSRFCCTTWHVCLSFLCPPQYCSCFSPSTIPSICWEQSYAGEDWLYWQGLVILVRTHTCAGAACFLYIVVISPSGKHNQWEHSFRTTTITSQVRHDSIQGEMR